MIAHAGRFPMPDDKDDKQDDATNEQPACEAEFVVDDVCFPHAFDAATQLIAAFITAGEVPDEFQQEPHHELFRESVKLVRDTIKHFQDQEGE